MKQDFNKAVGQAVQADAVEISDQSVTIRAEAVSGDIAAGDIHHHHALPQKLTRYQRRALNDSVDELVERFGASRMETWQSMHKVLGVNSIDDMHQGHYQSAETIFKLLIENSRLRVAADDEPDGEAAAAIVQLNARNASLSVDLKHSKAEYQKLNDAFNKLLSSAQSWHARSDQLDESAAQVARLTERNAKLGVDLKQANSARTQAEANCARALQQIDMLRVQAQALDHVSAERDRLTGTARDLRQQAGQLEAHLKSASLRLVAARRKVVVLSLGFAATALGCIYLTHRLLAAGAATPVQKPAAVAPVSDTHERAHATAASTHGIRWARHRVVVHRAASQDPPPDPSQLQPPVDPTNAGDGQVPGYVQQNDGN